MPYRIEVTRSAQRDLKALEAATLRRIDRTIRELANNPRPNGVEKLKGEERLYRVRVGAYRILYRIEDDVLLVLVVRVRHRREVYR